MQARANGFDQVFNSGGCLYTMASAGAARPRRRRAGESREGNGAVEVAIVLVALIILEVLAFRFGADSRDGFGRRGAREGRGRVRLWWADPEQKRRPAEAPAAW